MGLGRPNVEQLRAARPPASWPSLPSFGARAPAPSSSSAPEPSGSAAPEKAPERAIEFAPLPASRDPAAMPTRPPWPMLNPEASPAKAWAIAEGPRKRANDGRRLVTLTFDDGPFPETTPTVLRMLAKQKIHATFFVIGRYLDADDDRGKASREVLKSVVAAGHLVGNHTHDHQLLTSVSHTQVLEQIDRGSASIERVIGKRPILFRPPFGQLDEFGQKAVRERGLDMIFWSAEARDMERNDTEAMFSDLVRQLTHKEGGIVLLHDIRKSSIVVLERLLAFLRDRPYDPCTPEKWGYVIVDLPTYLREIATANEAPVDPEDAAAACETQTSAKAAAKAAKSRKQKSRVNRR
jgi:peptidoglycan-N-acetylglucosamine deacetylase